MIHFSDTYRTYVLLLVVPIGLTRKRKRKRIFPFYGKNEQKGKTASFIGGPTSKVDCCSSEEGPDRKYT